jgi:hypothetical protein
MRITRIRSLANEIGMRNPETQAHELWYSLKSSPYALRKAEAYKEVIDELFTPYTWLGDSPIIYTIADDCTILCADCARKIYFNERIDINSLVYNEGPTEYCEECNAEIESAYGDPEEEEDKEELYNGWPNYETWNLILWSTNDEVIYHDIKLNGPYTEEQAKFKAYELFPNGTPDLDTPEIMMEKVDYEEVAKAWNELVEE